MRVMTSKGDDGEVKAGTLVSISLNRCRIRQRVKAKLDLAFLRRTKTKDEFRSGETETLIRPRFKAKENVTNPSLESGEGFWFWQRPTTIYLVIAGRGRGLWSAKMSV